MTSNFNDHFIRYSYVLESRYFLLEVLFLRNKPVPYRTVPYSRESNHLKKKKN